MNEPICFAAGMRILPLDRAAVGMVGGEHLCRYVSGAAAEVVNVECVKELDQSPFLERRQPQSRRQKTGALASKAAREVKRHVGTQFAHAVERQKHGRAPRGLFVAQTDMQLTRAVGDHQFTTISIRLLKERLPESAAINRTGNIKARRRGLQDQGPR